MSEGQGQEIQAIQKPQRNVLIICFAFIELRVHAACRLPKNIFRGEKII